MSDRLQTTEPGFVLEVQVPHPATGATNGHEGGTAEATALASVLANALAPLAGERVRITVEVVRQSRTERLRALIERFREESEEQPSRRFSTSP